MALGPRAGQPYHPSRGPGADLRSLLSSDVRPHRQTITAVAMLLNPEDTYVHLRDDGVSQTTPGGVEFWSLPPDSMAKFDQGWLISEFVCTEHWANWEMHPHGDEFVYLLNGDIELLLELPSGTASTRIYGRGAQVVPRGVWHTAMVFAPSRMLFVTRGEGTQHRPNGGA